MIIENKNLGINTENVNSCESIETLKDWMVQIEIDIARMTHQINEAKQKSLNGDYSDPKWFRSIHSAKRLQGILKQQIQNRLSVVKKLDRPLCSYIIDVIREEYTDEEWSAIVSEAMELKNVKV